jgi:hypothetical protein
MGENAPNLVTLQTDEAFFMQARVARLGEFSPIGRFCTLSSSF